MLHLKCENRNLIHYFLHVRNAKYFIYMYKLCSFQVIKLWPDELHIKNFLEGNSYKGDVSRRNHRYVTRFIDDMAAKKAALGDNRLKWSEWLPEIQCETHTT